MLFRSIGRFAHLVRIADQLGATAERDHFLSEIKNRLEDWFTAGGAQEYVYNDTWDVLTGYPSGYGADNQVNDHVTGQFWTYKEYQRGQW